MSTTLSLYKLEKTTKSFVESLGNFNDFTPLSAQGEWLPYYDCFKPYESYFVKADLTYFDVEKGIQRAGYEMEDVEKYHCGHGENGYRILCPQNKNLKLPDAQNYICFSIKVKEKRRYDLYWEYVATMRTYRKPLQQQLQIYQVPLYKWEEWGIYHPKIVNYRGGLKNSFYGQLQNSDFHITNKITAIAFFEQFALSNEKKIIVETLCEPFVDGQHFIRLAL